MAFLNEYTGELNLKVLYVGSAGCGKTTNIRSAYKQTSTEISSRLFDLHGLEESDGVFDFLPLRLGDVSQRIESNRSGAHSQPLRVHLYTLPSHDCLATLNQTLFMGVDGIVFIVDSRSLALPENERQWERMNQWLLQQGRRQEDVPLVSQFNHRDASDALPIRALKARFQRAESSGVEAVAVQDVGVLETIDAMTDAILASMEGVGNRRMPRTFAEAWPRERTLP